jgi:hypothetical protein
MFSDLRSLSLSYSKSPPPLLGAGFDTHEYTLHRNTDRDAVSVKQVREDRYLGGSFSQA